MDVSLWFVLARGSTAELDPDLREYRGVRWFPLDRREGWPADRFDPEMGRFISKVKAALDGSR